jgi:hypothetical protein
MLELTTKTEEKPTRILPEKSRFPDESKSSVALTGLTVCRVIISDSTTSFGTTSIMR